MKTKLIALLTLPLLLFASCSDDDDDHKDDWVPENVKTVFYSQYPKETIKGGVDWEKKLAGADEYYEAEFWNIINGKDYEVDAYYSASAVWVSSKIELGKDVNDALVPQLVKEGINSQLAGQYAGWYVDDIDLFQQKDREDTYIVEFDKKGSDEVHVNFDKEGQVLTNGSAQGADVSTVTKAKFEEDFKDKILGVTKWKDLEGYKVVEFETSIGGNRYEIEAWYDNNGQWFMTETEIKGNINDPLLPEAVRKAFEASQYKASKVDDLDKIERVGLEPIYVIEIDGTPDVKLFYTQDGILVKEIAEVEEGGNNSGLIPSEEGLSAAVKAVLDAKFSTYRLVDIDTENTVSGMVLEVEIVHNGIKKEVFFDKDNKWLATEWDVRASDLPVAVSTAIKEDADLSSWTIDDVERVENADGVFFRIEFEKGNAEQTILFDEKGGRATK